MSEHVQADVVVLGMGPGGEEVAERLADEGLQVVGIESHLVGGECPYWGCIPSKMMIRAANLLAEGRRIPGMAGTSTVEADWAPVARRIRDEATDDWNDQVAVDRFVDKGGRLIRGSGTVAGSGLVTVGTDSVEARRAVVLATGTKSFTPPIPGLVETGFWTNHEAIETEEVPERLVVLGGGAIGAELAQVFARFGAAVTVVEAAPRLVPMEEPEASEIVGRAFDADGITVRTGVRAVSVERRGASRVVHLDDGTEEAGDELLVAVGRRADLRALSLGTIGIDVDQPFVPVDGKMRVTDGVWAVGDLTGKGNFTHVAMYQARIAIADILGRPVHEASYHALPRVTFTDPEVGSVGLSEQSARDAGVQVRTGSASVPRSARGWIHKADNDGVIKLVEDAERGVLIGATSVGPLGGEVLGLLALAVHASVPTAEIDRMIFAYPTFHRAIGDALSALLKA